MNKKEVCAECAVGNHDGCVSLTGETCSCIHFKQQHADVLEYVNRKRLARGQRPVGQGNRRRRFRR